MVVYLHFIATCKCKINIVVNIVVIFNISVDIVIVYFKLFSFRGTKIVLKGDNSAHLFDLEDLARKAHIPHYLVHDAGKTQVYLDALETAIDFLIQPYNSVWFMMSLRLKAWIYSLLHIYVGSVSY